MSNYFSVNGVLASVISSDKTYADRLTTNADQILNILWIQFKSSSGLLLVITNLESLASHESEKDAPWSPFIRNEMEWAKLQATEGNTEKSDYKENKEITKFLKEVQRRGVMNSQCGVGRAKRDHDLILMDRILRVLLWIQWSFSLII